MELNALPPYFVIKVEKQIQKDTREKDGYFYTHSDHVFMQREVQHGEIVSIGKEAQELFPEAKVGHELIFHHFLSGREMEDTGENKNLLFTDDIYKYYSVTVRSHKGERNLTYGIWDGEKIIPNKDFIFLEIEDKEPEVSKTNTGILELQNFSESKDEISKKMKFEKDTINELTKTAVTPDLKVEIENREKQMNRMSKQTNKKQYLLYRVAYASNYIKEKFIKPFTHAAMLSIACNTRINFGGKEFIISDCKYLSCVR